MKPHRLTILAAAGALAGLLLAGLSTYDFMRHLDRQVHDVHCAIGGGTDGGSGCKVAMMSAYSSVLRRWVWGGLPIALPAMALFAFLLAYGLETVVTGRQHERRSTAFFTAVAAVPLLASVVMASISAFVIGSVCTICVGIYLASIATFAGAFGLWWKARRGAPLAGRHAAGRAPDIHAARPAAAAGAHGRAAGRPADPAWVVGETAEAGPGGTLPFGTVRVSPAQHADADSTADQPSQSEAAPAQLAQTGRRYVAAMAGLLVLFIAVPVGAYLAIAPDHSRFVTGCGRIHSHKDLQRVLVPLGQGSRGRRAAIEVVDPLCPACAAFEHRLRRSGLADRLDRRLLLMPLDDQCNWMVERALHPGACTVSEAVLCAGPRAQQVLDWAFDNQEQITKAATADAEAALRMVLERFPSLRSCIGSPRTRARLNRSLRWAVNNQLPVLTPQLYVGDTKVCDEDLDLGLDYMLSRMLDASESPAAQRGER